MKYSILNKVQFHALRMQSRRFDGNPSWKSDRARLRKLFNYVKSDPRKYTTFEDYAKIYDLGVTLRSKGYSDFIPNLRILTPQYFTVVVRNKATEDEAVDAMKAYVDMFFE